MKYFYIALIAFFLLLILRLFKDFLPWIAVLGVIFLPAILLFGLKKLFPTDTEIEKRYPNYPFHRNWLSWTPLWRSNEEFDDIGITETSRRTLFVFWIIFMLLFGWSLTEFNDEFNRRADEMEKIEKEKKEKEKLEKNKKKQNQKTALVILPKRFL